MLQIGAISKSTAKSKFPSFWKMIKYLAKVKWELLVILKLLGSPKMCTMSIL